MPLTGIQLRQTKAKLKKSQTEVKDEIDPAVKETYTAAFEKHEEQLNKLKENRKKTNFVQRFVNSDPLKTNVNDLAANIRTTHSKYATASEEARIRREAFTQNAPSYLPGPSTYSTAAPSQNVPVQPAPSYRSASSHSTAAPSYHSTSVHPNAASSNQRSLYRPSSHPYRSAAPSRSSTSQPPSVPHAASSRHPASQPSHVYSRAAPYQNPSSASLYPQENLPQNLRYLSRSTLGTIPSQNSASEIYDPRSSDQWSQTSGNNGR